MWKQSIVILRDIGLFQPERIPEYQDYKIRLGRALIHEIESLIPGLEKSILRDGYSHPPYL